MRLRAVMAACLMALSLVAATAVALGGSHAIRRLHHRHSFLTARTRPPALLARGKTRKLDASVASVSVRGTSAAPGRALNLSVVARRVSRTPRLTLRGILSAYLSPTAKLPKHRPAVAGHGSVVVGKKGKSKPTKVTVVIPLKTKPGTYTVFVCLAVLGHYRDSRASNNCHAGSRRVAVVISVPTPKPPPTTTATSTTPSPPTTTTTTTTTTSTTTTPPPGNPPPPGTPVPVDTPAPAPGPQDAPAPSAASVAPTLTPGEATTFRASIAFLFTGSNPIQKGVSDPSKITESAAALVHGVVTDTSGAPLGGVRVSVIGAPQYGYTDTATDGSFAMAVNGGAPIVLSLTRAGYIPIQQSVAVVPVNQSTATDPAALSAYQGQADDVNLSSSAPVQVAQGNVEADASGTRQATLLFAGGTHATMHFADGSTQPLIDMHVRTTEFTVGAYGPAAMPGTLPPTSAYTYADDFSVDEAVTAGATAVTFDKPVIAYVNNFLGFPTGAAVPSGSYNGSGAAWTPSPNGIVVKVLSTAGGTAQLSVDSTGNPATAGELQALGITSAELEAIAVNYAAGDSLWRVPLLHFSSWDFNFLPDDHRPDPPNPPQPDDPPDDNSCHAPGGSTIMCDSQAVGEDVTVAGTPYTLHYQSDRVPAYKAGDAIDIPVTATTGSLSDVDHADVDVDIDGHAYHQEYCLPGGQSCAASAIPVAAGHEYGLTDQIVWDHKDGFGRTVTGGATAQVTITYAIVQQYSYSFVGVSGSSPGRRPRAAGDSSGSGLNLFGNTYSSQGSVPARQLEQVSDTEQVQIAPAADNTGVGLGDWSLSAIDSFDPITGVLHHGDGSDQSVQAVAPTLAVFAGGGAGDLGDGGPATSATLQQPEGLLQDPDGSVLIADCSDHRVRKVGSDGTISTFAGDGTEGDTGDGGQAAKAQLGCPISLARTADGTVYVADNGSGDGAVIRRVAPDGTITTFAGGGQDQPSDAIGNPATDVALQSIAQIAAGADGSLYIADSDHGLIERIDPSDQFTVIDYDSSNGTTLGLQRPTGVAVNSSGVIFVADADENKILRLSGTNVTVIAGDGTEGDKGDHGPAANAELDGPGQLSLTPDGQLFIVENFSGRVRLITTDGLIRTVAGGGDQDPTEGKVPSSGANLGDVNGVVGGSDGTLLVSADGYVFATRSALTGVGSNETLVPSSDGSTVDAFDAGGRELATYDAISGTKLLSFTYDSAGRVSAIADALGRKTTVLRNGSTTEIVAPGGQTTTLTVNADGRLASITDPTGAQTTAMYAAGQLSGLTDPAGKSSSIVYDSLGRVTSDTDPAGATTTLSHTLSPDGFSLTTVTLPGGRTQTYADSIDAWGDVTRTSTDPAGGVTEFVGFGDGTSKLTLPDGTTEDVQQTGDPRFGMAAPVVSSLNVTTPDGAGDLTESSSRSVTLADPDDPLSVKSYTESYTIGEGSQTTLTYEAAARTLTTTSPEGRTTTSTYDGHDELISETRPQSADAITYTRDGTTGLVTKYAQGDRSQTLAYDAAGNVTSNTNAAGEKTEYGWDGDGRLTSLTRPDGKVFKFGYDPNGRLTTLTDPSGGASTFSWTAVGQLASYLPPTASAGTAYAYDAARNPTLQTLPDAQTQTESYDSGGRLTGVAIKNDGNVAVSYDGSTGDVTSLQRTFSSGPAQTLTLSHDGDALTKQAFAGPATGSYAYQYNDGRLTDMTLTTSGQSTDAPLSYDGDGLPTGAGPLSFSLDSQTGLASKVGDQTMDEQLGYDTFGDEKTRDVTVKSKATYSEGLTRDNVGRITSRTEKIGATSHTYSYTYDSDGRLTAVKTDGTASEAYAYDGDGNLTSRQSGGDPAQALSYDGQDRQTGLGATSYSYNADGQLAGRGADTFSYGPRTGELESAKVGATTVTYRYDALGRRVARTVGSDTEQYLYGDPIHLDRLTASIAPDGTLTTYLYDHVGRLIALTRGGTVDYVATNLLGSPQVVTDASGTVLKQISYDAYGKVLSDSAPSFPLEIGFDGGLTDSLTGLVHLGARDYDPASGRFTERGPTLYAGGLNLYAYVGGDPIDFSDPTGLDDPGSAGTDAAPAPSLWQQFKDYVQKKIDEKEKSAQDAYDACYEFVHGTGPESAVPALHQLIDWATGNQVVPITPGDAANQALDRGVDAAHEMQSFGAENSQLSQAEH